MELTYGQLEAVLAGHFRIHPDRIGTFRSRIKQLQRLQFPPGVNVGRGAKMGYNAEHLLMLTTAFELIGFGQPAQTACNLVTAHWTEISGGYALAAIQQRRYGREARGFTLAILWIETFHEIQIPDRWGAIEPSRLKVCDEAVAARELASATSHNVRLMLSITKILLNVLEIASKRAGVRGAGIYDEEYHGWLPREDVLWADYKSEYPDRSNIKMRQRLHRIYKNDEDSLTPEGAEEARDFISNDYSKMPF